MQTNHASILSELLMASTALGAGVMPPFKDLYDEAGMVFAATVSDEFKSRMRRATVDFNRDTAAEESAIRQQIHQLESDVTNDAPGALDALGDARMQLDSMRYPFCHDHAATRDMVLELAVKSRHKHVAVLDDQGFRLSMSLKYSPTFARESSMLPMTIGYGMAQANIRINGSGGLINHTLGGGITPAFSYFSAPPPELAKRLADKLSTTTILSPLKGHAVIISERPTRGASIDATTEDILKLLNTYYVIGHMPDNAKAVYVPQSDELLTKWQRFLSGDDVFKLLEIPDNRLDRADKILQDWHIKPRVAAAYATRAVLCAAAIETVKIEHNGNLLKIALRDKHLEQAIEFFKELYRGMMARVHSGSKLADNAAQARAAKAGAVPSPARQEAAIDALVDAIKQSPNRMISRDAAIRLPKVSPALLDYLVENNSTLVELRGREIVNMGKTKRAYALKIETSNDVGEALDDLEEATKVYAADKHDHMFANMETVRHEIMRLAQECDAGAFGLPAVPITNLLSRQIRCLPAILDEYPECFVMRGTPDNPELPHLVKTVTDPDAPLEPDIPVVWVRRTVDGRELRDWKMAVKLGFSEVWSTT